LCETTVRTRTRLTQARLRELLHYDPETGEFRWLKRVSRFVRVGSIAGGEHKLGGYSYITMGGRGYPAHQLAWLYMTGKWCRPMIDHHDGNRGNNRWSNLRRATRSENNANRLRQRNNTSGFKGVTLEPTTGKWRARISKDRLRRTLGTFRTPEAAHEAYTAAARRLFGEFARAE
jgi:hypothetical protein